MSDCAHTFLTSDHFYNGIGSSSPLYYMFVFSPRILKGHCKEGFPTWFDHRNQTSHPNSLVSSKHNAGVTVCRNACNGWNNLIQNEKTFKCLHIEVMSIPIKMFSVFHIQIAIWLRFFIGTLLVSCLFLVSENSGFPTVFPLSWIGVTFVSWLCDFSWLQRMNYVQIQGFKLEKTCQTLQVGKFFQKTLSLNLTRIFSS